MAIMGDYGRLWATMGDYGNKGSKGSKANKE
jgi:hypothetical protein